ncbi:uncharacterized protein MYCFIDRAFT_180139 [Pseudocercospora fijiensis CIRAD86]|uniref:Uncharacterized protein n=1 Tax=Pseudocercospora fijiensis (strain CIRAD86) TaxID=383855 RepID=M2ZYE6_PSEFD|nr:uncharacterized protein MYCFIDRAFT_180139 [Pseudocercospora fijiensis CIRAD86]EME77136.1 hypothetical protein MYCFIDRAFT_180139 [Pseudocercospora fijiensis CIRAD86]
MASPLADPSQLPFILGRLQAAQIPSAHHIEPETLASLYAEYGRKTNHQNLQASMTEFWKLLKDNGPAHHITGVVHRMGLPAYIEDAIYRYEKDYEKDWSSSSSSSGTSSSSDRFGRCSSRSSCENSPGKNAHAGPGTGQNDAEHLFAQLNELYIENESLKTQLRNLESRNKALHKQDIKQTRTLASLTEKRNADKHTITTLRSALDGKKKALEVGATKLDKRDREVLSLREELAIVKREGREKQKQKKLEQEQEASLKQDPYRTAERAQRKLDRRARKACSYKILGTMGDRIIDAIQEARHMDFAEAVRGLEGLREDRRHRGTEIVLDNQDDRVECLPWTRIVSHI